MVKAGKKRRNNLGLGQLVASKLLVLGRGTDSYDCPYLVGFLCSNPEHPIEFAEGIGFGSGGQCCSPSEALLPSWKKHFSVTKTEWFIPLIESMARGEGVSEDDIVKAYERIHHQKPEERETQWRREDNTLKNRRRKTKK